MPNDKAVSRGARKRLFKEVSDETKAVNNKGKSKAKVIAVLKENGKSKQKQFKPNFEKPMTRSRNHVSKTKTKDVPLKRNRVTVCSKTKQGNVAVKPKVGKVFIEGENETVSQNHSYLTDKSNNNATQLSTGNLPVNPDLRKYVLTKCGDVTVLG